MIVVKFIPAPLQNQLEEKNKISDYFHHGKNLPFYV